MFLPRWRDRGSKGSSSRSIEAGPRGKKRPVMEIVRRHQRLFAYDEWANRETLTAIAAARRPQQRALRLMAHIAGEERLWLGRLRHERLPEAVWPALDLAGCRESLGDL